MSADNMIVIRRVSNNGGYGVSMEFASDDWEPILPFGKDIPGVVYFDNYPGAVEYAFRWYAREVIVEYGVYDCVVNGGKDL